MKCICLLTAALFLLLSGCNAAADPQALAALEDVMAAVEDELPPGEQLSEPPAEILWDGEYSSGSRTITLSLGANGTLRYRVSDGGVGRASEVKGAAAKTASILFALNGDTLSVLGGGYTGNYERQ